MAELGKVNAFVKNQPCVELLQGTKENLVCIVLGEASNGRITRLDMCQAPSPTTVKRSGHYPS